MDVHSSEPQEYFVLPLTMFQWEVQWNNSPNKELPPQRSFRCQGQTTAATHTNQSPGEGQLLSDSFQKPFPTPVQWAFSTMTRLASAHAWHPQSTHALAPPQHACPLPSKHFSFRLHHLLEGITSRKRKLSSHRNQFYLSLGFMGWKKGKILAEVVFFLFGPGLGPIRIIVKFKKRKKQMVPTIANHKTPTDHFKKHPCWVRPTPSLSLLWQKAHYGKTYTGKVNKMSHFPSSTAPCAQALVVRHSLCLSVFMNWLYEKYSGEIPFTIVRNRFFPVVFRGRKRLWGKLPGVSTLIPFTEKQQ